MMEGFMLGYNQLYIFLYLQWLLCDLVVVFFFLIVVRALNMRFTLLNFLSAQ